MTGENTNLENLISELDESHGDLLAKYQLLKKELETCLEISSKLSNKISSSRIESNRAGKNVKDFVSSMGKMFTTKGEKGASGNLGDITNVVAKSFSKVMGNFIAGARDTGGRVAGGSPYLVGEKGPEIFIPKENGTISNKAIKSSNNVVINITSQDVDSFRKSKSQIFSELTTAIRKSSRE